MIFIKNQYLDCFLCLLRYGLWNREARLLSLDNVDLERVFQLSQEQSVVGLVAAGLEGLNLSSLPQDIKYLFLGTIIQIEQSNLLMNNHLCQLINNLNNNGINPVLVKGQGIAQCYIKPLWRSCGDIDLLLSSDDYEKGKEYMSNIGRLVDEEDLFKKHIGYYIDEGIEVELHGTLRTGLWRRIDDGIDAIFDRTFDESQIRYWEYKGTRIRLPSVNNDIIFIFSHIFKHFFKGGIGLRQICDWCRLLYTYRVEVDLHLLESRLRKMGLISEWKAFAALAVNTLGMPVEDMPLYSPSNKWDRKSNRILALILESGNFGHNRDNSYYQKYPYLVYKAISLWRNTWDSMRHFMIFPLDATKVWWNRLWIGIKAVAKGK